MTNPNQTSNNSEVANTETDRPTNFLPENTDIHFIFTEHVNTQDIPSNIRQKFLGADVIILEQLGYLAKVEDDYNRISRGDSKVYQQYTSKYAQSPNAGFLNARLAALFNIHKPVIFADVEVDNDIKTQFDSFMVQNMLSNLLGESFEETCANVVSSAREQASLITARDEYTLANMGKRIAAIIEKSPKLTTKAHVSVVGLYGKAHTDMYVALMSKYGPGHSGNVNNHITREFKDTPVTYSYLDELARDYLFGVHLSEKDEQALSVKAFATWFLDAVLKKAYTVENLRSIIDSLELEDMRGLFGMIDRGKGQIDFTAPTWHKVQALLSGLDSKNTGVNKKDS